MRAFTARLRRARRSRRSTATPPSLPQAGLALGLLLLLLLEHAWLRRLGPEGVSLPVAALWAAACAGGALLCALALWRLRSWRQAATFGVCRGSNPTLALAPTPNTGRRSAAAIASP